MNTVLEVKNLNKTFHGGGGSLQAVKNVSFSVAAGACFAIVGESGSGKSTLARMIMRLEEIDEGDVILCGKSIYDFKRKPKDWYEQMQMVFQNPTDSFNPRITLGSSIMSPMLHFGFTKKEAKVRMEELLERVKLPADYGARYPHEVSGGECQRAAIARALGTAPRILICDEATSALDVSVQDQVVRLLDELRREMNLTIIFISHDLALVQQICDDTVVMQSGIITEQGKTEQIINNPQQAYTKTLLESVFTL